MKKIILLNLLLLSIVGYTQNAPINFETPGNGANWTWITFENGANTALQMVPNPDTSGINTSATVGKITVLTNSAPFAGVESIHQDLHSETRRVSRLFRFHAGFSPGLLERTASAWSTSRWRRCPSRIASGTVKGKSCARTSVQRETGTEKSSENPRK